MGNFINVIRIYHYKFLVILFIASLLLLLLLVLLLIVLLSIELNERDRVRTDTTLLIELLILQVHQQPLNSHSRSSDKNNVASFLVFFHAIRIHMNR